MFHYPPPRCTCTETRICAACMAWHQRPARPAGEPVAHARTRRPQPRQGCRRHYRSQPTCEACQRRAKRHRTKETACS